MEQRNLLSLMVPVEQVPAVVWRLLSEPSHLRQWWPQVILLELKLGGRFEERWTNDQAYTVITRGTVTELEPPQSLRLTWADEDWPEPTRVHIRLEPCASGTVVYLEHSGWENFAAEDQQSLREAHRRGWMYHLDQLRHYAKKVVAQSN